MSGELPHRATFSPPVSCGVGKSISFFFGLNYSSILLINHSTIDFMGRKSAKMYLRIIEIRSAFWITWAHLDFFKIPLE